MRWSGQTGGTTWMQQALVVIFKYVDIRVIYAIMSFWLLWYVIVRPSATKAVYRFHRIRRNRSVPQACVDTYLSYFNFGQAIMDRFAVYSGYRFNVEVPDMDAFATLKDGDDGFYVLFTHLGNSEMAGYCLATPNKRMNILMYMGDTQTVMQNRTDSMAKNNLRIIPMVEENMSHIFTINEALDNGEIVAMAVDRMVQSKSTNCMFMGSKAPFPIGPFRICNAIKKPILMVFVFKTNWNSYQVQVCPIENKFAGTKNEQVQSLVQACASTIEQMALQYPYQWFNFYDFWAA